MVNHARRRAPKADEPGGGYLLVVSCEPGSSIVNLGEEIPYPDITTGLLVQWLSSCVGSPMLGVSTPVGTYVRDRTAPDLSANQARPENVRSRFSRTHIDSKQVARGCTWSVLTLEVEMK